MKLIMAISSDGYVARHEQDDMSWTGPIDKAVFKLLTSTEESLAVSAKTLGLMPKDLPGRGHLFALSTDPRRGMLLEDFRAMFPNSWLLGGQEIALQALRNGLVDKAYLCRATNVRLKFHSEAGLCQEDRLTGYFERRQFEPGRGSWWTKSMSVPIHSTMVDVWERGSAVDG